MKNEANDPICRINYLTEEIDSMYHRAAVKLGISDSVLLILYVLYLNDGACLLHDIYGVYGTSKQTVNSALRKLEQEHYLYLEKFSGKEKKVYLTETGMAYAKKTAARLYAAECGAFSEWSKEDIARYLTLIEKHKKSLKEQIEAL